MYHTVVVGEAMLVYAGELVVLDMPVGMSLFGESALDGGPEDGGGVLHSLEECPLPQLCFRLLSVNDLALLRLNCLPKRV